VSIKVTQAAIDAATRALVMHNRPVAELLLAAADHMECETCANGGRPTPKDAAELWARVHADLRRDLARVRALAAGEIPREERGPKR
jgi:hypothetical protein